MTGRSDGGDAVALREFETSSPDRAHEILSELHIDHRFRTSGPHSENFRYASLSASVGTLAVDHLRYSMGAETETDPIDFIFCPVLVDGVMSVTNGRDEFRAARGDVWINPPGSQVSVKWKDFDVMVFRMPLQPVAEEASASTGMDPDDLRFDAMKPVSAALGRHWRSTVAFVHRELTASESALSNPLVRSQLTHLIATSLLATFPNTTMTYGHDGRTHRVRPAGIRRAAAFIEANAHRAITTAEIAEAAGVTARALQLGFARHYDTTPMGYLRRIRLQHAHQDLQAADPHDGATVAEIARRWGFPKASRFAAWYGDVYGVRPSHTLRT